MGHLKCTVAIMLAGCGGTFGAASTVRDGGPVDVGDVADGNPSDGRGGAAAAAAPGP